MQIKIYFDSRDWWVGYYRGDTHHYICPLPTLVIRWPRSGRVLQQQYKDSSIPALDVILDSKLPPGTAYIDNSVNHRAFLAENTWNKILGELYRQRKK